MKGATTFSIKGMYVDTQHNNALPLWWVSRYLCWISLGWASWHLMKKRKKSFITSSCPGIRKVPDFLHLLLQVTILYTHICSSLKLPTYNLCSLAYFWLRLESFYWKLLSLFSYVIQPSLIFPTQRLGSLCSTTFPAKYKTCQSYYQA